MLKIVMILLLLNLSLCKLRSFYNVRISFDLKQDEDSWKVRFLKYEFFNNPDKIDIDLVIIDDRTYLEFKDELNLEKRLQVKYYFNNFVT